MNQSHSNNPEPYRFFSKDIFVQGDTVACDVLSIGDREFAVGQNVLHDTAALRAIARYWRSQLESMARRSIDYDAQLQTFIHVKGEPIPVDRLCAQINGIHVQLDFTGAGLYIRSSSRWRWTHTNNQYKALRLFASALKHAALHRPK